MRAAARISGALAGLAGLLLAAGCAPRGGAPARRVVRYRLEWSTDRVAQAAGMPGWDVVTDLGYRVHVQRGYLVSRSMELVECPKDAAQKVAGVARALAGLLDAREAYAGHSAMAPNPAALTTPLVEPLVAVRAAEAGAVSLAPQAYCRAHYLVARADRSARDLPADLDMLDKSLRVEGTYVAPGGGAPVPFALATSVADGKLVDLFPPGAFGDEAAALHVDTGRSGALVVIRRDLGSLFDGVAFAATAERDVARRVVQNLIEHARIEVEPRA